MICQMYLCTILSHSNSCCHFFGFSAVISELNFLVNKRSTTLQNKSPTLFNKRILKPQHMYLYLHFYFVFGVYNTEYEIIYLEMELCSVCSQSFTFLLEYHVKCQVYQPLNSHEEIIVGGKQCNYSTNYTRLFLRL